MLLPFLRKNSHKYAQPQRVADILDANHSFQFLSVIYRIALFIFTANFLCLRVDRNTCNGGAVRFIGLFVKNAEFTQVNYAR